MTTLTLADFADLFGADHLPDSCVRMIAADNWNYTIINGAEGDALLINLLTRLDARDFSIAANQDNSRWVKGWGENLAALQQSGDLAALVPKYYKPGMPLRLRQHFIRAEDAHFEINFFYVYRRWLFETYFKDAPSIFECGSGSGFNLAELGKLYPNATLHGCDWAQPAVDIVETLRTVKGLNAHGHLFDFFHPDPSLPVERDSLVYSFGALEQTGTDWQPLLDFLLAKKPARVLHIEPIAEWYEPATSLLDYTAARANAARGFLSGYATAIAELEKQGRARILKTKRLHFGSTWHEGWSQLFWQPL